MKKSMLFFFFLFVYSDCVVLHAYDINNDGKTDIAEAIFALQVVAGNRPNIGHIDPPNKVSASDGQYVDKIKITWQAPPNAEEFTVYRFDLDLSEYVNIGDTTNTFFDDTTGNAIGVFYYKVKAYSKDHGYSILSDYDSGYRERLGPPGTVTASYGLHADKITVQWAPSLGAQSYFIYRSLDVDGNYQELATTTQTTFEDKSTVAITDYYYKVKSFHTDIGLSENYSPPTTGYRLQQYQLVRSIDGTTAFRWPYGLATDSNDYVYFADHSNGKITVFDSDGNYHKTFVDGLSQNSLRGLVFDNVGNLYVADSADYKIRKYDKDGKLLLSWGASGTDNGQFHYFRQITSDSSNNVYVTDHNNHRVQVFDSGGNFIRKWGQNGTNNGEFEHPWGIAIDSEQNVYVSDSNKIQKFDLEGNFIEVWKNIGSNYITIDSNGNFFISSGGYILKFDSDGKLLAKIGGFDGAQGVAVINSGRVFGADQYGEFHGILIFDPNE